MNNNLEFISYFPPATVRQFQVEQPQPVRVLSSENRDTNLLVFFLQKGIEVIDKADSELVNKYPEVFRGKTGA